MNFAAQATLHGAGRLSGPKNSLFNAMEDALKSRDLTLAYIDGDDGFHLAGVAIRTMTETPAYAAHKAAVWAKGLTRD